MRRYQPAKAPDPATWLALDEDERLEIVVRFHRQKRVRLPNLRLHAVFHVIVENQLAEQLAPALAAMDRLLRAGLDRHEAVHAIGSRVAAHLHGLMTGAEPQEDANERLFAALEQLTAESWRAEGDPEDED